MDLEVALDQRLRSRWTASATVSQWRAKDDSRDAEVMASALRTDPRCFRPLAAADPIIVELREWSRIAEDLGVERNRLVNRLREQLWRYLTMSLNAVPAGLQSQEVGAFLSRHPVCRKFTACTFGR